MIFLRKKNTETIFEGIHDEISEATSMVIPKKIYD